MSAAKKNASFVEWSRVKCTGVASLFNGRKRVIAFSSRSPTTFKLRCLHSLHTNLMGVKRHIALVADAEEVE